MHALAWLLWRDSRNAALGVSAHLKRPRGALAAAGLLLFFAVVLSTGRSGARVGESLPLYGPPALMVLVLLGAFSPLGLYFRPPDVHWLLPAPLARWQLVVFNVAVRARPALFSGLMLSLLPSWRVEGWWAAFTGYTLAFGLLQVSAQWMAGVRAWLALHASARWRRMIGLALIVVPVAAVALELRASSAPTLADFVATSSALAVFGAPARPFLATIAAPDLAHWLAHAALSAAILAAAVAHLCVQRIPFLEIALVHSERRTRRFARMRGGDGAFGPAAAVLERRMPMLPRLGGAGPVAWRQLQELVRNPRGLALIAVVVTAVTGVTVVAPLLREGDPTLVVRLGRTGMFLVTMLPLLMAENLACDFRRDFERLDQLKTWPIAPFALAAGQIAPAVLCATGMQALGLYALFELTHAVPGWVLGLLLALLPVVSWVALSIDNLFFLWIPYRTVPEDPGDVGFVGRTFATALFKFLWLGGVLGGTLALTWVALEWTGSPWAAVGIPIATLLAACFWCTWAVALAFQRFDVARDAVA